MGNLIMAWLQGSNLAESTLWIAVLCLLIWRPDLLINILRTLSLSLVYILPYLVAGGRQLVSIFLSFVAGVGQLLSILQTFADGLRELLSIILPYFADGLRQLNSILHDFADGLREETRDPFFNGL